MDVWSFIIFSNWSQVFYIPQLRINTNLICNTQQPIFFLIQTFFPGAADYQYKLKLWILTHSMFDHFMYRSMKHHVDCQNELGPNLLKVSLNCYSFDWNWHFTLAELKGFHRKSTLFCISNPRLTFYIAFLSLAGSDSYASI